MALFVLTYMVFGFMIDSLTMTMLYILYIDNRQEDVSKAKENGDAFGN